MSAQPVALVPVDPTAASGRSARGSRRSAVARGLSRSKVAAAVGVSTSFLGMVERGETDMSLARFTRLTGFLGVSVADLLSDDPTPAPPESARSPRSPAIERGEGVDFRIIRREHPQLVAVTLAPGARFADVRSHRGEDIWIVTPARRRSSTAPSATPSRRATRSSSRASSSTASPTTPTSRSR